MTRRALGRGQLKDAKCKGRERREGVDLNQKWSFAKRIERHG